MPIKFNCLQKNERKYRYTATAKRSVSIDSYPHRLPTTCSIRACPTWVSIGVVSIVVPQ
jgi:hypothetical protein